MKVKLNDYGRGAFIKIIREWTGLTQKEFGKILGKSERTIQGYESGTIDYSIKTLENVCREFHVTLLAEGQRDKVHK